MPNEWRRSPWQLKEGEYPEGAKQTKKAFEVDLCALMKLMKVNSLPDKPSDNAKKAFENAMERIENFLSHASDTFPLVHEEIMEAARKLKSTLKKSEHLRIDVSKLDDIALCAICGGLASMGLKEFTPDLWEDPLSAWNMSHRSIAIRIFQSTCRSGGLRRWSPVKNWYENNALLERFYNHYVFHYL
ncbi:hypothetical protein PQX77_017761 [Marasmius sp. AFHP31]|nr:hypothetical protein PQX77_017761 [Marasmius sp. AFHP31]